MGLFGKGKKKEDMNTGGTDENCAACSGSSASASKTARFIVLGACCDKSRQTLKMRKRRLKSLVLLMKW